MGHNAALAIAASQSPCAFLCFKLFKSLGFFVKTSKPKQTRARLVNAKLAHEAELVSLAVGKWAVDRWKKMILLIYIVKQKQTRKREWSAGVLSRLKVVKQKEPLSQRD